MRSGIWLLFAAIVVACDTTPEAPARRAAPSVEPSDTASAQPLGPPLSPPVAGRCVDPTPFEAKRPPPPPGPDPQCPEDPDGRFDLRWGKVRFPSAELSLSVELAVDDAHRMRGLMYRKELAEDEGMLFVFDDQRHRRFWMKNTCIPLDMLFIAEDGLVVGIEENVPTLNLRNYSVGCPAKYVLEVNAGWSRRHGVVAGQRVRFEGVDG